MVGQVFYYELSAFRPMLYAWCPVFNWEGDKFVGRGGSYGVPGDGGGEGMLRWWNFHFRPSYIARRRRGREIDGGTFHTYCTPPKLWPISTTVVWTFLSPRKKTSRNLLLEFDPIGFSNNDRQWNIYNIWTSPKSTIRLNNDLDLIRPPHLKKGSPNLLLECNRLFKKRTLIIIGDAGMTTSSRMRLETRRSDERR